MYSIDTYISKKLHITKNPKIAGKIWHDFETACQNKKIILYGISELINILWLRCGQEISIIAAVDNDKAKQGHKLNDFFDDENLKSAKDIVIKSKEILANYNPDEVVILISSLRYYEEIAEELESQYFLCYFSILNLECYYREYLQVKNLPLLTEEDYIHNYSEKCVELYPIQNNKIIFCGMGIYSDHCKYITEQLISMNKDFDIVWIINKPSIEVPKGIRTVYEGKWKQYIYELETAKVWVYGVPIRINPVKREEQIYIQTKHWGSITLKKFYLDDAANESKKKIYELNAKMLDYIITGSEFDENSCRRGFNFNGKFLRFGSPRSDALFEQKKYKSKIYEKFNLHFNERILLYAPTYRFRDTRGSNPDLKWQGLNFEILLNSLQQRWSGAWKIFLRLHPLIRMRSNQIKQPNFVVDVSNYEDSQELVAASEVVISDFSSIIFEPAYVMKPVFLYAPDKEEYEKRDYELLLDYNSLPFPISTTNEELSKQIRSFDEVKYKNSVKEFLDKYGVHEDGHASERSARFIFDLISKSTKDFGD